MKKFFKDKKILITAGPVWVPIDRVRVITNIFGGALGYVIAKQAAALGADVTLLMGPGRVIFTGKEKFQVIKYRFYEDIYSLLEEHLKTKTYDMVLQSSAIPDYVPKKYTNAKIKSGKKDFTISFKPTKKIIDQFRKWDPNIFIVKFKLEVDKTKEELIEIAFTSMTQSKANLIVANDLNTVIKNTEHKAYIIDRERNIIPAQSKETIATKLLEKISQSFK